MKTQSPTQLWRTLVAWLRRPTQPKSAQVDSRNTSASGSVKDLMLVIAEEMLQRSGILTVLVLEVGDLLELESIFGLQTAEQVVADVSERLESLAQGSGLVLRTAPATFTALLPRMEPRRALESAYSVLGDPCELRVEVYGEEIVLEADFALQTVCRDAITIEEVYDDLRRQIENARHSWRRVRPNAMLPERSDGGRSAVRGGYPVGSPPPPSECETRSPQLPAIIPVPIKPRWVDSAE